MSFVGVLNRGEQLPSVVCKGTTCSVGSALEGEVVSFVGELSWRGFADGLRRSSVGNHLVDEDGREGQCTPSFTETGPRSARPCSLGGILIRQQRRTTAVGRMAADSASSSSSLSNLLSLIAHLATARAANAARLARFAAMRAMRALSDSLSDSAGGVLLRVASEEEARAAAVVTGFGMESGVSCGERVC